MYLAMLLVTTGILSCDKGGKEVVTDFGMKYTIHIEGNGEILKDQTMLISFVAFDENDSIWMDSRPNDMHRPARKVDSIWHMNKGGIEEVLFNIKKGDSISFKVPVEKIYGNRSIPAGFDKNSLLTVGMKVVDALNEEEFNAYRKEMVEKEQKIIAEKTEEQLKIDIETIDIYLSENNIDAQKTESGLRYVITQGGQGEYVQSGQIIKANYSGHVLDGAYFDTSVEEVAKENGLYQEGKPYAPLETVIGQGRVIKGWDEAFQLMNTGSKATLYIPSGLAYGPRARSAEITANAILVFDVELIEIIAE